MKKRGFSSSERYAASHQRRCWRCLEPLRLIETTIDHVIPESLLQDEERRVQVLADYGLHNSFNIDGFENWLPCHNPCNQRRGSITFTFVPGNRLILDRLIRLAPTVQRTADTIRINVGKDELFARMIVAVERQTITLEDIQGLVADLTLRPAAESVPAKMIRLDNGYWLHEDDVVREGQCRCERETCVG